MNLIIHDLEERTFNRIFNFDNKKNYIVSDNGSIKSCTGCFGCWIKTPGTCVIKDGYEDMGKLFSKAGKVLVFSQCYYGGYSPFVKNVLDRSISYLLPFFKIKNNETHHKQRYKNKTRLYVYFYGEQVTQDEMETARNLVRANGINFNVAEYKVVFTDTAEQAGREVAAQWK